MTAKGAAPVLHALESDGVLTLDGRHGYVFADRDKEGAE